MDAQTTQRLVSLNNEFYRSNAESFSATRQYAWDGWVKLARALPYPLPPERATNGQTANASSCTPARTPGTVIDVACGNMRFSRFLDDTYGHGTFGYVGVDACDDLVPNDMRSRFVHFNILGDSPHAPEALERQYSLVACFGFMHHVPGKENRRKLVDTLLELAAPQGHVCISFWQFGRNEMLLQKATKTTAKGTRELGLQLEKEDYLLGWKDVPRAYRYCHNFTDAEIDDISRYASSRARVLQQFRADGKTGDLNTYLVLEKAC